MKNLLLIAALAASYSAWAQGGLEAIPSYNQSAIAPPLSSTAGWTFETTTNLIALDLGCFTNVFLNNPSATKVEVGLWAQDGSLLASTDVTPASTPLNHSLYEAITPVFLSPGLIYYLGVFSPPDGSLVLDASVAGDFSTTPDISVRGTALGVAGFTFPVETQPLDGAIYAGPNFQYQEGVPEPACGLLLCFGGLLLVARRWGQPL
jgi:hypothetical protein